MLIVLSGCGGGGPSGQTEGGASEDWAPGEAAPADPGQANSRIVAKSASVTVHVADPLVGAEQVRAIAQKRGGWVTWENISLNGSDGLNTGATVMITVPANDFEDALTELAGIGTLESRSVDTEDVTDQVIDLQARIDSKRASIKRIEALMERAGSVSDIAAVESELASRQSDLESLLAQQKYYASITDFASISVQLTSPAASGSNPLWAGLQEGWSALQVSVRVLLVVVGALLPFLAAAALVAVAVVWWVRHRRSRTQAASRSGQQGSQDQEVVPPSEAETVPEQPSKTTGTPEEV